MTHVAPMFPFGDPGLMLDLVSYASSWVVVVGILLFHGRPILMPHPPAAAARAVSR